MVASKKRSGLSGRPGRHRRSQRGAASHWLRAGVVTAGMGAAIALGSGVADASPGDESGKSATSKSTRGPASSGTDNSASDSKNSAGSESRSVADDSTSGDETESIKDAAKAQKSDDDDEAASAVDEDATAADADTIAVDVDEPEFDVARPSESFGDDTEPDAPAPPVEALGLAVRNLQDRRETMGSTETSLREVQTDMVSPAAADVAVAAVAADPPNWFETALNSAWNVAKTVTNVVVNTVVGVLDAVRHTTMAVINGVTRLLWGDYIPKQNPTTTPGHWQRLQTVTGGLLNDGFHIDKIRSAYDGVERLVVYIGGTTLGLNQAAVLNGSGWFGDPKPWHIYQLGLATEDNPDIEILMFGFSQGGMDAQNLVARTDFNVKMVVTFGSPIVQDPPDPLDVWMLHLQAEKDPIVDWSRPGLLPKAVEAQIVYRTPTKTSNSYWAEWNPIYVVHGDRATYLEVAKKLDAEYLSDSNMDYWEGQYIRSY